MPDSPSPAIDTLTRALEQAQAVVAVVTDDQLELPTPCEEWTVRQLLRHMVGGLRNFRRVVDGGSMVGFDADVPDPELASTYADEANALLAAWRADGVFDRPMTMFGGEVPASMPLNLQVTETALHTWDLAVATGARQALDDEVAESALAFSERNLGPERRGKSFGLPREAPPGADAYQRLAAYSGRRVDAAATG